MTQRKKEAAAFGDLMCVCVCVCVCVCLAVCVCVPDIAVGTRILTGSLML